MTESLRDRAKAIIKQPGYAKPFITAEGYGSLLRSENTCDIWTDVGDSLKINAESIHSKEAVEVYMEGLYFYLRAQAVFEGSVTEYALRQRKLYRYIDDILVQTRKYDLRGVKDILKWTLFNLKIQCLFKEREYFGLEVDSKSYNYVLGEISSLRSLYMSNSIFPFDLVKIENIETRIKQMLQNADICR
ncbi:hypothetical protein PAEPH01_0846 [Pancytospora epiphaga]|nr:hypothetical protein PAEPH01_0846 [Pancytospora epiphaga]